MKKLLLTLLFVISSTLLQAEDLIASLGPVLMAINPELTQQLEEAINDSGHNLTIINLPTGRSLDHFSKGDHHIEIRIPSFAEQVDYATAITVPVSNLTVKAFVNKNLGITNLKGLEGMKFASIHGLAMNEVIMAKIPNIQQKLLRDFDAVSKYVAAGRSDFFVQEEFAGVKLIQDTNTENDIVILDESLLKIPLFIYIHNNKSHIIRDLKPVLEKMVQEGKFK